MKCTPKCGRTVTQGMLEKKKKKKGKRIFSTHSDPQPFILMHMQGVLKKRICLFTWSFCSTPFVHHLY